MNLFWRTNLFLFAEVVCDQIWRLRNKVLCDSMGVDPIDFVRETNKVFESHWKEHFLDMKSVSFNATVKESHVTLAAVCRK